MKIQNVYKFAGIMVLFVALQSRSTGPGGTQNLQVSGAPGSTGNPGTCANTGCHTAGSFAPQLSIDLLDTAEIVTGYEPGKSYTVRIINRPTTGTPLRYGFQAVSLNTANTQAGQWGTVGSGKQKVTLSGRSYVEHSVPSTNDTFFVEWIAPAANTGDVTFYAASIASNNNGSTSGDGTANNALTVSEILVNSLDETSKAYTQLNFTPNPADQWSQLEFVSERTENALLQILDLQGRVVRTEKIFLQTGSNRITLETGTLPAGLYLVQLTGTQHPAAGRLLKQ